MSEDEGSDLSFTVGSLIGVPLGSAPDPAASDDPTVRSQAQPHVGAAAGPSIDIELTTEERGWTVLAGNLGAPRTGSGFRPDGVEALTYDNPFGQDVEQVWFDGKVVYAVDAGEVDIDPSRVKVAQEYQIVYAAELGDDGKAAGQPERVPDHLNIYDSVPGMEKYSPIWQFNYVVVPRDYRANTLRSENDCLTSGYPILKSQDFEN